MTIGAKVERRRSHQLVRVFMQHITIGLVLAVASGAGWADTWECRQLRDVLIGPPYYVDQEKTDIAFDVEVSAKQIRLSSEVEQIFHCQLQACRQPLSGRDFLIKGDNSDATFILSVVGANVGFNATYSVTSKPSVGETLVQMGVCAPSVAGKSPVN